MFSPAAQRLVDVAKDVAATRSAGELTLQDILTGSLRDPSASRLLGKLFSVEEKQLRHTFPEPSSIRRCQGRLPLATEFKEAIRLARRLALDYPSKAHPSLISVPHLVCAAALSLPKAPEGLHPPDEEAAAVLLAGWLDTDGAQPSLAELTRSFRVLRCDLLDRLFGQDQAVNAFVDGLFNVELVCSADETRTKPAGLFILAGPPASGRRCWPNWGRTG